MNVTYHSIMTHTPKNNLSKNQHPENDLFSTIFGIDATEVFTPSERETMKQQEIFRSKMSKMLKNEKLRLLSILDTVIIAKDLQKKDYVLTNKEGKIISQNYTEIDMYPSENHIAVKNSDDKWGLVNLTTGGETIPCRYKKVHNFENGFGSAMDDTGLWGYFNAKGEQITPFLYESCDDFVEGRAAVKKNGLWGFIDENGYEMIPCIYDDVERFDKGVANVRRDFQNYVVDLQGRERKNER